MIHSYVFSEKAEEGQLWKDFNGSVKDGVGDDSLAEILERCSGLRLNRQGTTIQSLPISLNYSVGFYPALSSPQK